MCSCICDSCEVTRFIRKNPDILHWQETQGKPIACLPMGRVGQGLVLNQRLIPRHCLRISLTQSQKNIGHRFIEWKTMCKSECGGKLWRNVLGIYRQRTRSVALASEKSGWELGGAAKTVDGVLLAEDSREDRKITRKR